MKALKFGLAAALSATLSACGGLPESCEKLLDELEDTSKRISSLGVAMPVPTREDMAKQLEKIASEKEQEAVCKQTLGMIKMIK
ncbi:MAG: hypothetical protein SOX43_04210 [Pelistega sp.]|nr:hypothetical protein [Pelistega sp.]